jgi:hypothetical protein
MRIVVEQLFWNLFSPTVIGVVEVGGLSNMAVQQQASPAYDGGR